MDQIDPTNIYTLLMLLAYVMRRAGTFSMEEKVEMIKFLGYMAANPHVRIAGPPLGRAMQSPVGRLQAPTLSDPFRGPFSKHTVER